MAIKISNLSSAQILAALALPKISEEILRLTLFSHGLKIYTPYAGAFVDATMPVVLSFKASILKGGYIKHAEKFLHGLKTAGVFSGSILGDATLASGNHKNQDFVTIKQWQEEVLSQHPAWADHGPFQEKNGPGSLGVASGVIDFDADPVYIDNSMLAAEPLKIHTGQHAVDKKSESPVMKKIVSLVDAEAMYQPVYGTSKGSVYYMIASDGVTKVAARRGKTSLSLRVETPNILPLKERLEEVGFNISIKSEAGKSYASLHLTPGSELLIANTIGSVLMGLRLDYLTVMPNLNKLASIE